MRKNSRDELSGAVRDETVAEFRRQEKEVPPATSRPFRLTPMLPPRRLRTFLKNSSDLFSLFVCTSSIMMLDMNKS
jgi:hypothetical protein